MSDKDLTLAEIRSRVIRIETRMVTLAEGLGVDLKEDTRIRADNATAIVDIDAMDVTLSNVCVIARKAGLHGRTIQVRFEGEFIAKFRV